MIPEIDDLCLGKAVAFFFVFHELDIKWTA